MSARAATGGVGDPSLLLKRPVVEVRRFSSRLHPLCTVEETPWRGEERVAESLACPVLHEGQLGLDKTADSRDRAVGPMLP